MKQGPPSFKIEPWNFGPLCQTRLLWFDYYCLQCPPKWGTEHLGGAGLSSRTLSVSLGEQALHNNMCTSWSALNAHFNCPILAFPSIEIEWQPCHGAGVDGLLGVGHLEPVQSGSISICRQEWFFPTGSGNSSASHHFLSRHQHLHPDHQVGQPAV